MIVRELLTRLGFDADEKKVKSFDSAVKNLTKGLMATVAAATAAGAAALKLANDTARYGDEVAKTARVLGVGARELQQYRFAFDRLGVSQGEADTGLQRFNMTVGQAVQGMGRGAEQFERLGISIRNADGTTRRMSELLPEVSDALSGIASEADRAAIANDLFGRSGGRLAAALAEGGDEIRSLISEYDRLGGGLSGEQAKAAEEFTDRMTDMRTTLHGLRMLIGARLMPVIGKMIKQFTEFMVTNRKIISDRVQQFFTGLIAVMRVTARIMKTVWRTVDGVAQAMGGWENTIRLVMFGIGALIAIKLAAWLWVVVKAMRALNIAMLLNPATLWAIAIMAIVAALALLIDDIWNFLQGNESVLGKAVELWHKFAASVKQVFADVIDWVSDRFNQLIDNFVAGWLKAGEKIRGMWRGVVDSIRSIVSGMLPGWALNLMGFDQSPGGDMGRSAAGDTRVSNRNLSVAPVLNVTVPPGTSQEQIDMIQRTINRTMIQQIDDAALALETR